MQALPLATLAIKVESVDITPEIVRGLKNLALGEIELEIPGPPDYLCDSELRMLSGLPIAHLDLSGACISYWGLAVLHGLPLTSLNLEGQDEIKGFNLDVLRGMTMLASLNLGSCIRICDRGLAMLRGLPITKLNISNVGFVDTSDVARTLRELPALKDLCIDSEHRVVLAGLPLTKLCLSRSHYFGEVMGVLPPMPLLVDLCLDGGMQCCRPFIDADLLGLRGLSLVVFSLHVCPWVTNAGLEVLRGMISLKWMYFSWCPLITQEGLATFGNVEVDGWHMYVDVFGR